MGPRAGAFAVMALVLVASPAASAQGPAYVEGELLVRFAPRLDARERAALRREHGLRAVKRLPVPGLQLVRLPEGLAVPAAARELEREPAVLYAEPNGLWAPLATPNDLAFQQQWGLHNTGQTLNVAVPFAGTPDADIDAPEAWNTETGSADVTVAIVDSGVAYDHEDLAANMWTNPGESGGGKETNGLDDDTNGFVDDVRGWDFFHDDNDPIGSQSHGTAVAGAVGAAGNNGREMAGVNWDVTLMPLRQGGGFRPDITQARIAAAFGYAVANGADIVNASFGGAGQSQAVREVIELAPEVLFIAGAGNDGTDNDVTPFFPCNIDLPNVICVAATDADDELASFSNFADQSVHLAAPGVSIIGTNLQLDDSASFSEDFEADISGTWTRSGAWDRTNTAAGGGTFSLADSPGGNYANNVVGIARNTAGFSLAGRKGCSGTMKVQLASRTEFQPMNTPPRDDFFVVASPTFNGAGSFEADRHNGAIPTFTTFAFDLSNLDGDADAFLLLVFGSNNDTLVDDGVYVDDIEARCLKGSFDNPTLIYANGTSLATPLVSGVAALVMAHEPSLSAVQVKERILATVDAKASLAGKVVTGGRLNAARALDPSIPFDPDPDADPDPPTVPTPPPPTPPGDPAPPAEPFTPPPTPIPDTVAPTLELSGSVRQRAKARRITIVVRCPAEPCTVAGRGRRLRGATAPLQAGARTRLVFRISRAGLKAIRRSLRRKRSINVVVTITATDAAGNITTKRRTIRLRR